MRWFKSLLLSFAFLLVLSPLAHAEYASATDHARFSLGVGGGLQWFEARRNKRFVREFQFRREPVVSLAPSYQLGQSTAIVGRVAYGLDSRLVNPSLEFRFTFSGK